MTLSEYNRFCSLLPMTTHVVQWGGADVWKVGGKVFSLGRWQAREEELHVTFKASELGYEIMREMPGLRPAPYLASRGLKWIQRYAGGGLDDDALQEVLREAHALVVAGLTQRVRRELGLAPLTDAATAKRSAARSKTPKAARSARHDSR